MIRAIGVIAIENIVFTEYADFSGHELVTSRQELTSGLTAFIAIHNTFLGPAIGGCRIMKYARSEEAIRDVLRLSRGMTYKSAISGIPYGGGKAVILADPGIQKTRSLLHAMGDFVESLGGRYITAFDSGTTVEDVAVIGERTAHTAGTLADAGNASSSTAYGVYQAINTAVRVHLRRSGLEGVHVAIQGIGNVGYRLAILLNRVGARLSVADCNAAAAQAIGQLTNATVVDHTKIHKIKADVFAPCALGAVLSAQSIPELGASIVVGGANNQLATPSDDMRLTAHGILYCPDYVANAGGIIDLHYQRIGWSRIAVERHIDGLSKTFEDIIERSRATGIGTGHVADELAERCFKGN